MNSNSKKSFSQFLRVAQQAALASGQVIREQFSKPFALEAKSDSDFTVEVDNLSENAIIEILRQHFPGHSIFSEEAGQLFGDKSFLWMVDPLDGTNNFVCGIPYCGVALSLLIDGIVSVAVVYQPFLDRLYWATVGLGAFCNGKRFHRESACHGTRNRAERTGANGSVS
ncbi:MAG: hypothetical protein KDD64_15060, partial [Bdellovibrionales bacterium]|nr:hypothetical protein [Bdellovibrionales bacterium]